MRTRDRISFLGCSAALAVALIAAGGASRLAIALLAVIAAVAAASQISSRRRLVGVSPLLLLVAVLLGLTLLQVIPLPDRVVATLEPAGHTLMVDGERLAADGTASAARFRPLSLDPGSTRLELLELCAYALLTWLAVRAAASEAGRQRLIVAVTLAAGGVAILGIGHELVGATALFGIYEPRHLRPIIMAPLMNANHLASLMAMGAVLAAGLALHDRGRPTRVLWVAIVLACIGVAVATRSRGGIIGLSAGATVTAVLLVLQGRRATGTSRRDIYRVALPAAVIVLCALVLVIFLGDLSVRRELESTRLDELGDPRSKYAAWGSAFSLLEEAPVLGVGRGAFESAFPRVHDASSQVTFSHLENEYLQALVDWGVVGAAAIAGSLLLALLVVWRRWHQGVLMATALGALSALAVHSLVDFGLDLPALAVPSLLVAATIFHVPMRETSARLPRYLRAVPVAATLALAVIAATTSWAVPLAEDHDRLTGEAASLAAAREALARHPLDYVAATTIAGFSSDAKQRLAYLNHAMRLHPGHPGLHRMAARWLLQGGHPSQASLEYRLAVQGSGAPEMLVREILRAFPAADAAAAALPDREVDWNRIVFVLIEAKRADVAVAYLRRVVVDTSRAPVPDAWRRLANLAEDTGDLALAEWAAKRLYDLEVSTRAKTALARIQVAKKDYDAALATLGPIANETITSPDHLDARMLICDIHIARLDHAAARLCLTALLTIPGGSIPFRRGAHARLARVEEALGNRDRAVFERSLAQPGKRPDPKVSPTVDPAAPLR